MHLENPVDHTGRADSRALAAAPADATARPLPASTNTMMGSLAGAAPVLPLLAGWVALGSVVLVAGSPCDGKSRTRADGSAVDRPHPRLPQLLVGHSRTAVSGQSEPAVCPVSRGCARRGGRPCERWRRNCRGCRVGPRRLRTCPRPAPCCGCCARVCCPPIATFHADLLFHQTEETLFGAFFVGRACEAILQQGAPWDETERIVRGALSRLNDYIGHRPVAALETRRHEPYPHEWLRPVPLYIEGAGVEIGRYHDVVTRALEILRATDEYILRAAHFDPALLEELAFDPRAYDFDHPVNKRPNYHFGQWDPHHIDNAGRYRRFVVQQVTLEALMARVDEGGEVPHEQLLFEAAAVLAGTMLMASGISGSGPGAHDSTVTLSSLLPTVAAYRDAFYEQLIRAGGAGASAAFGAGSADAASAVWRRSPASQCVAGASPRQSVGARPPGEDLCPHGARRRGGSAGGHRAGRLGPHAVRDRLPFDSRRSSGPGGRSATGRGVGPRHRGSAPPGHSMWSDASTRGICWGSMRTSVCFRRSRTVCTTIEPTNWSR